MGTTAEKLTYLNTTKQLIKEAINLTDANITNEPFRQYASILEHRLPEIVGDPSIIWNNYEHVTGTGTSFSITAYNSIIDYKLKGDTTQTSTPTPDAPVPVNVVTGNQTVSVSDGTNTQSFEINLGKNLFNSELVRKVITNASLVDSTTRICTNDFIKVKPNTTYTISFNTNANINNINVSFFTTNEFPGTSESSWTTNYTFTTGSNINYVMITFRNSSDNTITLDNISNVQLETGTQATSYSPYFKPIELCKIGDYQDRLYKQNGKWYLHKEIGKVVLNGTEEWSINTGNRFRVNLPSEDGYYVALALSNRYTFTSDWDTHLATNYSFTVRNGNWGVDGCRLSFINTNYATVTAFKNEVAANNITVYYQLLPKLGGATDTEISDGNLINQLNAVSLITGLNNISVSGDLPAILDLTALKYE